jgi:hypothetical protein
MISKIPAFIAAALILGSASAASAAVRHQPASNGVLMLEETVPGTTGGYSADPETRRLERLNDKYSGGWSEYIR